MDVYWLEQTAADVPEDNHWLSPGEVLRLQTLRVPKRLHDWRLGRWTAKCALIAFVDAPQPDFAAIEVRPAPTGAPEVFLAGRPAPVTISLSHRSGRGLCAVARSDVALGCDLEAIEHHSDPFIADYFTDDEQALIARCPPSARHALVTLLWSAKESALKALHHGLRLDTRCVAVRLSSGGSGSYNAATDWQPLEVLCPGHAVLRGWWRSHGATVRTLVAAPAPRQPFPLDLPTFASCLTHSGMQA